MGNCVSCYEQNIIDQKYSTEPAKPNMQKAEKHENTSQNDTEKSIESHPETPKSNGNKIEVENIQHIPIELPLLNEIPDQGNELTKAALKRFGEFLPRKTENDEDNVNLPFYGPTKIDENIIYFGQWKNKVRHGKGKQYWADGSIFEGNFKNDQATGKFFRISIFLGYGRMIHCDGDVYEGEWQNDNANGLGIYFHHDGGEQKGEWVEDKQHGFGIEKWADCSIYEGNYIKGMKTGKGIFHWADGSYQEGYFFENKIEGKGTQHWGDEREYTGEWKGNKMHGTGVFQWKDGRKQEGEQRDDKKEGFGIFQWPDGRMQEGNWKDGMQHGAGLFTDENLNTKKGIFENGKLVNWELGGDSEK